MSFYLVRFGQIRSLARDAPIRAIITIMNCWELDATLRKLITARGKARLDKEGLWTKEVSHWTQLLNDHRREGHDGKPCFTTEF
jgi:hypothetical protein